jgi:peptide/nickel transport system permease protein
VFWLSQVLIMLFAVQLGWLPAQGMGSFDAARRGIPPLLDFASHWILPGLAVTIYYLAVVARVGRASLLEALHQDFVTTARSIGLGRRRILFQHVLPNGLIPIVTVIGYNFGYALTGAILAETVFGWPGLGNLFIVSVENRDYPILEAMFLMSAISIVIANLLTDMAYFWIDPRIRAGYTRGS